VKLCSPATFRIYAASLACLLWLCSLPCNAQSSTTPADAMPSQHEIIDGVLVATDLEHGLTTQRLSLTRVWSGQVGIHEHFGAGWSDPNVVTLHPSADSRAVIIVGGRVWMSARKVDDEYRTLRGDRLSSTKDEWLLVMPSKTQLRFNRDGRLVESMSPSGAARKFEYDKNGLLQLIQLGEQNFIRYHYGDESQVSKVEGPEGLMATFKYDSKKRLIQATNVRGTVNTYQYRPDGDLLAVRDSHGTVFTNGEPKGPATLQVATLTAAAMKSDGVTTAGKAMPYLGEAFENDAGTKIVRQKVRGRSVEFAQDVDGRVISRKTYGETDRFEYDEFSRLNHIRYGDATSLSVKYNARDDVTSLDSPTGESLRLEYDDLGRRTRVASSDSSWEQLTYDGKGRLAEMTQSEGLSERYSYDAKNALNSVAFGNGDSMMFVRDEEQRPTAILRAAGQSVRLTYDKQGELASTISADGLRTEFGYDKSGELSSISSQIHGRTSFEIDRSDGNSVVIDHPRLGRWGIHTNDRSQLLNVTRPDKTQTQFEYDQFENISAVRSTGGHLFQYKHDDQDQLTEIRSPLGHSIQLVRDEKGRVKQLMRGSVKWREYNYDSRGRTQVELSPLGIAAVYTYDDMGRVTNMVSGTGNFNIGYKETSQPTSIAGAGFTIEQEFHQDGSLAKRKYSPVNLELSLPIDALGREAGVELNDVAAKYEYGGGGHVTAIQLPQNQTLNIQRDLAGRIVSVVAGTKFQLSYQYDEADRVTSINATAANAMPVFGETYSFDAVGNVSRQTDLTTGRAAQYEYDGDDQLIGVKEESGETEYTYDADGTLTKRIDPTTSANYELDSEGRPVRQTLGATYQWDAAGQLVRAGDGRLTVENKFDAAGSLLSRRALSHEWSFGYGLDGDRLWQKGPAGTAWYAYSPSGLAALQDEAGTKWLIVYLPGTTTPIALCGSGGEVLFVVADRLGSIRRVVDAQGQLISETDYDAYGRTVAASGRSPLEMFAGMLVDEHGLHYARQRYYDPALQRFISIDPLVGDHHQPASHHAYAYAANNPLRYRDPFGMRPIDLHSEVRNPDAPLFRPNVILDPAEAQRLENQYIYGSLIVTGAVVGGVAVVVSLKTGGVAYTVASHVGRALVIGGTYILGKGIGMAKYAAAGGRRWAGQGVRRAIAATKFIGDWKISAPLNALSIWTLSGGDEVPTETEENKIYGTPPQADGRRPRDSDSAGTRDGGNSGKGVPRAGGKGTSGNSGTRVTKDDGKGTGDKVTGGKGTGGRGSSEKVTGGRGTDDESPASDTGGGFDNPQKVSLRDSWEHRGMTDAERQEENKRRRDVNKQRQEQDAERRKQGQRGASGSPGGGVREPRQYLPQLIPISNPGLTWKQLWDKFVENIINGRTPFTDITPGGGIPENTPGLADALNRARALYEEGQNLGDDVRDDRKKYRRRSNQLIDDLDEAVTNRKNSTQDSPQLQAAIDKVDDAIQKIDKAGKNGEDVGDPGEIAKVRKVLQDGRDEVCRLANLEENKTRFARGPIPAADEVKEKAYDVWIPFRKKHSRLGESQQALKEAKEELDRRLSEAEDRLTKAREFHERFKKIEKTAGELDQLKKSIDGKLDRMAEIPGQVESILAPFILNAEAWSLNNDAKALSDGLNDGLAEYAKLLKKAKPDAKVLKELEDLVEQAQERKKAAEKALKADDSVIGELQKIDDAMNDCYENGLLSPRDADGNRKSDDGKRSGSGKSPFLSSSSPLATSPRLKLKRVQFAESPNTIPGRKPMKRTEVAESPNTLPGRKPMKRTEVTESPNRIPKSQPMKPTGSGVIVPSLIGKSAEQVQAALQTLGLRPDFKMGHESPSVKNQYKVYQQKPVAKTMVDKDSQVTVTLFNKMGGAPERPMNPKKVTSNQPIVIPKRPQKMLTLSGKWKCSCGGVWLLSQNGTRVSGRETDDDPAHSLSIVGTFDGKQFQFTSQCICGRGDGDGRGIMTLSADGNVMKAKLQLSTGKIMQPTLTRMVR